MDATHAILKGLVTAAIAEVPELGRYVNLKSEILAHAAVTLDKLKEASEGTVRTLVDMEGSYLSANFFREIVAAESFSYDPNRPKPQFVTLTGACCCPFLLLACICAHCSLRARLLSPLSSLPTCCCHSASSHTRAQVRSCWRSAMTA